MASLEWHRPGCLQRTHVPCATLRAPHQLLSRARPNQADPVIPPQGAPSCPPRTPARPAPGQPGQSGTVKVGILQASRTQRAGPEVAGLKSWRPHRTGSPARPPREDTCVAAGSGRGLQAPVGNRAPVPQVTRPHRLPALISPHRPPTPSAPHTGRPQRAWPCFRDPLLLQLLHLEHSLRVSTWSQRQCRLL